MHDSYLQFLPLASFQGPVGFPCPCSHERVDFKLAGASGSEESLSSLMLKLFPVWPLEAASSRNPLEPLWARGTWDGVRGAKPPHGHQQKLLTASSARPLTQRF